MKSDDNIKKFFEKRLGDSTEAEDGWNIPSDDIWNSAKVHFPKKKKKNRPFLYFLFGAGTMLLITLTAGYFFFTENKKDHIVESVTPIILNDETQEVNRGINLASSEKAVSTIETISEKEKEGNISTINPTKTTKREPAKNRTKSIQISEQKTFSAASIAEKQDHFLTENTTAKKIETQQTKITESPNIINQNEIEKPEFSLAIANEESANISTLSIVDLPTLASEIESNERPVENNSEIVKIKSRRKINKWELGLSHAPLILLPLVKADVKNDDEIDLDIKFRNLNGMISRRLSRRFSVTSGLMFSSLDVGIDFENKDVYEMGEVDVDFKGILPERPSGGTLGINEADGLDVTFIPDANLMNGDSVLIKGSIPMEVRAVQMPFLINYHFGKRKFEGLIHAGFSLDYSTFKINSIDLDIFKEDVLVSESVNFEPESETYFDISAYLGVGVKYHINDRLNIGLSTKIEVRELIFSRYEFGVYYGF